MAILNTNKTIWPYNLRPLITRETPFPAFLYDVSKCLVMVFRSCPVMAHLVFKHKSSFKLQLTSLAVITHPSAFFAFMSSLGSSLNLSLPGVPGSFFLSGLSTDTHSTDFG